MNSTKPARVVTEAAIKTHQYSRQHHEPPAAGIQKLSHDRAQGQRYQGEDSHDEPHRGDGAAQFNNVVLEGSRPPPA